MHSTSPCSDVIVNMTLAIELCIALAAFNIYHDWNFVPFVIFASTFPKNFTDYESMYQNFDRDSLSPDALKQWQTGEPCGEDDASDVNNFFCPMPFEPSTFTSCCKKEREDIHRCCEGSPNTDTTKSALDKWGIGLGVVIACFFVSISVIYLFNKCTKWCADAHPDDSPRPKLKITAIKQSVKPVDKRTLLKTGNYTVEQSWDQVTVKFYNREFYESFRDSLLRKYKDLKWRDARYAQEGDVTNALGEDVGLRMDDDTRLLRVTKTGNTSWVMNDFQNVCKGISVDDVSERRRESPMSGVTSLSPRLPTIGEEFFDTGDYHVKISQSEVEIKFAKQTSFDKFKRMLLYRYPTLPWSKYLQRDCAQIRLESGKNVTVHLWEDIRSVWLSGDGKKDWYNKEFQELYADAVYGQIPGDTINISRPHSATSSGRLSRTSGKRLSRGCSLVEIPATYTVKNLENGGMEIEFPSSDFVCEMKSVIESSRTGLSKSEMVKWSGHSAKVKTDTGKSVVIQVGSQTEASRKIWLYNDPACKDWFNKHFKRLYAMVYENIHKMDCSSGRSMTESEATIAPVEHTA